MSPHGAEAKSARLDVAYCYPAPYWHMGEGGWVKSLLLFFDKVSILLPDYMYGRHHLADPVLAKPLADRGLLEVLEPTHWVDHDMAGSLAEAVSSCLTAAYSMTCRETFRSMSCPSPAWAMGQMSN